MPLRTEALFEDAKFLKPFFKLIVLEKSAAYFYINSALESVSFLLSVLFLTVFFSPKVQTCLI